MKGIDRNNRHFWAREYYVDRVGRNKKQIQEYIKSNWKKIRYG